MDSTAIIRYLNDAFRTAMCGNGEVCWTPGIVALSEDEKTEIMLRVHCFDAFTPDNDPHGEHDFGSFEYAASPRCRVRAASLPRNVHLPMCLAAFPCGAARD